MPNNWHSAYLKKKKQGCWKSCITSICMSFKLPIWRKKINLNCTLHTVSPDHWRFLNIQPSVCASYIFTKSISVFISLNKVIRSSKWRQIYFSSSRLTLILIIESIIYQISAWKIQVILVSLLDRIHSSIFIIYHQPTALPCINISPSTLLNSYVATFDTIASHIRQISNVTHYKLVGCYTM